MGPRARSGARVGVSCTGVVLVVLLAVSGAAGAASPRPITGKLSRPDHTVIAVAADGRASTVRAGRGSFALRPPAGSVTLHLRGPDGVYAGPVVIRGLGSRRVIVGVRAGARLGSITVEPTHARLGRRLRRRWIDARYVARARNSVPIGAGRFGRVRSKPPRSRRVPGDLDRDGVPNPLDIDDDGDLTLDSLDRTPRGPVRARAAARQEFGFEFNLRAEISETVNANAGAAPGEIDDFLVSHSDLTIPVVPGDSAELDCAGSNQDPPRTVGLRYCSAGGTGTAGPRFGGREFPGPPGDACCFDRDGDGFGSIGRGLLLNPRAKTADIAAGDVLVQHAANDVDEDQCPLLGPPACVSYAATLQYVPATTPALVAYSDGQGNCARVSGTPDSCATEFSYPVPGPCPPPEGVACSGPGTRENPFPVKAGPGGDIVLTVSLWRPQHRPIPGSDPATATWMDVGLLGYGVQVGEGGQDCGAGAFSEDDPATPGVVEDDPDLEITPTSEPEPGIVLGGQPRDRVDSRPADPTNTLTYTVNLTKCLAVPTDAGPEPEPWNPGQTKGAEFVAGDAFGSATLQGVFFRRLAG